MPDQAFAHFQLLKLAQSLPAGSRVALFRLGSKLTMLQGFNEDTAKLIEMLRSSKADPQMGPFYEDADMSQALSAPDLTAGMGGSRAAGPLPMAAQNANADLLRSELVVSMTLRALVKLGLYLGSLPGRKNLDWLAESFPIDILPNLNPNPANTNGMSAHFAGPDPRGYMTAIRDLAFLLQSNNIVVYPIDVREMMQRANPHTREFSELTDLVVSSHRLLSVDTDKDASGGSFAISSIWQPKHTCAHAIICLTSGVHPRGCNTAHPKNN